MDQHLSRYLALVRGEGTGSETGAVPHGTGTVTVTVTGAGGTVTSYQCNRYRLRYRDWCGWREHGNGPGPIPLFGLIVFSLVPCSWYICY